MSKGTILIIDDDPDMALVSRLVLEQAGYGVLEARNGSDGLAMIKAEKPDLILLDVMMESATEGFQTALTLRSHDPNSEYAAYRSIPIIMLTSIHSTAPVRFGPDEDYLPIEQFLDKPVTPEVLVKSVEDLLKSRN